MSDVEGSGLRVSSENDQSEVRKDRWIPLFKGKNEFMKLNPRTVNVSVVEKQS